MSAHAGEERLGPYRLGERLGEGGMGVVYLASDSDDRLVAVKVLRQGVPEEATARRRLAREVETMQRIRSPYVAEVIDADVEGNPPYIVTQYVAGQTLEDVVAADGPLTGPALANLARGLAAALVAVHSAGVVHRDLKPGNVMLVDGEPVVIDFGIAQTPDATSLTMTGMFMGTPGYLAPEVIEGRPSGPAADVHSWGATLAYAATGRPPFGTGQFEAIFYRVVHGQPDLDAMPAPLLPLVLSALARDPSKRPSADEIGALAAGLDPDMLVPAPAGAAADAAPAVQPAWASQVTRTALDVVPRPAVNLGSAAPDVAWPGTRPLAAPVRDDFADLLTPVQYQPVGPAGAQSAQAMVPPQLAGGAVWSQGLPVAGMPAAGRQPVADARPIPGRALLVMATLAALVAASVLLPVAGGAAALAALILLAAADLTTGRLARRRAAGPAKRADLVSAAAFYPWAVVRSALRFVLLAPLALLCAAGAAALAVLAGGPTSLPKAGGYAVGALVACYCIGPGSKACRRPLGKFYGRITGSAPAAVLGSIALVAVAVAVAVAAVSLTPGYWPAIHLGNQLQTTTIGHSALNQLPGSLARVGRSLIHWIGRL